MRIESATLQLTADVRDFNIDVHSQLNPYTRCQRFLWKFVGDVVGVRLGAAAGNTAGEILCAGIPWYEKVSSP